MYSISFRNSDKMGDDTRIIIWLFLKISILKYFLSLGIRLTA